MEEIKDYKTEVLASKGVVVVDFTAVWCGPCKALKPTLTELEEEYPTVKFLSWDIDRTTENEKGEQVPDTVFPSKLDVRSVPTVAIFKNGNLVEATGPQRKVYYKAVLDSVL